MNIGEYIRYIVGGTIIAVLVCVALTMAGCKTQTVTQSIEKVRIEKEIVRDTTIVTKADSATIHALFECDSTNQVVLRQLDMLQGERLKTTIKTTSSTTKGLQVVFDCKEDSLANVIILKDRIIEDLSNQKEVVTERIHYKTSFDKFCIWFFWIVIVIVFAVVAFKVCDKIPATKPYTTMIKTIFKFL